MHYAGCYYYGLKLYLKINQRSDTSMVLRVLYTRASFIYMDAMFLLIITYLVHNE